MLLHISKEKRSTHSWIICTTKRNKNGSKVNLLSQCQWYLSCLQRTEYISFRFLLYLPACTPSAAAEKVLHIWNCLQIPVGVCRNLFFCYLLESFLDHWKYNLGKCVWPGSFSVISVRDDLKQSQKK